MSNVVIFHQHGEGADILPFQYGYDTVSYQLNACTANSCLHFSPRRAADALTLRFFHQPVSSILLLQQAFTFKRSELATQTHLYHHQVPNWTFCFCLWAALHS